MSSIDVIYLLDAALGGPDKLVDYAYQKGASKVINGITSNDYEDSKSTRSNGDLFNDDYYKKYL